MEDPTEFNINESLKLYLSDPATIPTAEADSQIIDCETEPDLLTPQVIDGVLEPIAQALADNPGALTRGSIFDTLQALLKCAPISLVASPSVTRRSDTEHSALPRQSSTLPPLSLSSVLDILVSGLAAESETAHHDVEADEQDATLHHKTVLEMYAFLLQWTIAAVETKAAEKSMAAPARRGPKGGKLKSAAKDGAWDSTAQIQQSMEIICRVMKLRLNRLFQSTADRDTFINLFTRPIYLIMESESRMKITSVRMFCFKVLCIAVKHHGHGFGAQTSIVQNLTYFEHLSEPMAEFLHILSEQYDYPQLAGEIMRELAAKDFSPNDLKGPKSVAAFVIKLSELEPRLVIKEMGLLAKFLDSEAYTLRCAVIEVCGNLLADVSKQEEQTETNKIQINAFFDTLEQRFLDTNPYCRCRAIQVFMKICDLETKFPKRRQHAAELAAQSLQDKSSNVRRNAIKLLGKLVSTHPFGVMHGSLLSHKEWSERLEAVEAQIVALQPPPDTPGFAETASGKENVDADLLDEATTLDEEPIDKEMTEEEKLEALRKAEESAVTSEMLGRLQLTEKYYLEAIRFIEIIHEASETALSTLIRTKQE